jgi:hypothetical protein
MIRNEIGDKLPEGAICRSRAAHGSLQESERQAENILWSLAKNLASLKENFTAMTDHDMRQFLQVSFRMTLIITDFHPRMELI